LPFPIFIFLIFNKLQIQAQKPDLIPYLKDKVYGYADLAGNIKIIPQFRVVNFFEGQSALVEIKKNDTVKNVIINKKGEITFHNPGDKTLKLLPCGKYFTISESVKSKDHVLEKETLYTVHGELLQSFDGKEINITCVMDSVVFYLFNQGTDETGPYQYHTFDLTGKRQIPQGSALREFVFLNDSMLLSPQKQEYKLLRLHKHTFEYDQKFKTLLITAHKNLGNFLVFKNNKNQYGIANREGQMIVAPSFKRIINEDLVQTFSIKRSLPQEGYYSRFICLGFKDDATQEYKVSGKHLLKNIPAMNSGKSCFEQQYSMSKSAYMLRFFKGISTDTIFKSVYEHKDSTSTFIVGE